MKKDIVKEINAKVGSMVRRMDETYDRNEELAKQVESQFHCCWQARDQVRTTHKHCKRIFWLSCDMTIINLIIFLWTL